MMHRYRFFIRTLWFLCALGSVGLFSCAKAMPVPTLGQTPVVSGGLGWVVVGVAYTRMKTEPSFQSSDGGIARLGDVLKIQSRSRVFSGPDKGVWYKLSLGDSFAWLHESSVVVHE
ncbi:MAG TPA: hypothetical protein PLC54_08900, partial [Spirochaetales bacterium]|nr:hypothetical protein [Spirochaetales bacterium]